MNASASDLVNKYFTREQEQKEEREEAKDDLFSFLMKKPS